MNFFLQKLLNSNILKYLDNLHTCNLIKISPFISLFFCFLSLVKGSNATPFKTRSGDLLSWPLQFIE